MRFLLDVHLGKSLADLLEAEGHSCRLVVNAGEPTWRDIEILEEAKLQDEVVLTHDLDFGTLLSFTGFSKPSVVIFRVDKINSKVFAELILHNWSQLEEPLGTGAVVILEANKVRIRKLPIVRP